MKKQDRAKSASALAASYVALDRHIRSTLVNVVNEDSDTRRRRLLTALLAETRVATPELTAETEEWTNTDLMNIALAGAIAGGGASVKWDGDLRERSQEVAGETRAALAGALAHADSDIQRLVRAAGNRERLDAVMLGPVEIRGSELRAELSKRGVSAVIYRNGARHTLADYVDMYLKTAVVKVNNIATVAAGQARGIEWFQVADGPGCGWVTHDDGDTANGKVVTSAEAFANPLAHPRCQRSFVPVPAVTSPDEATQLQDELQAEDTAAHATTTKVFGQQRLIAHINAYGARIAKARGKMHA